MDWYKRKQSGTPTDYEVKIGTLTTRCPWRIFLIIEIDVESKELTFTAVAKQIDMIKCIQSD